MTKQSRSRRSDNKLAYFYLLTPNGIVERLRLTRTYLAIKEREYELIRGEIEELRKEVEA